MPILVDFSQVAIAGIMNFQRDLETGSDDKIVNLIRHVVLTSLISNKKKFGPTFGNIIICADGRNYWRKNVYPYYKAKRGAQREESKLNWGLIFDTINSMREDLRDNFPYKVVQTEGAEADDIIGVLTQYFQENELVEMGLEEEPQKILILSSDQDNLQLHKYRNVSQYSPIQKKAVKPAVNAHKSLIDKICMGDTGDGIPNIMSADNCLVEGVRQTSFRKARLEDFYVKGIDACANDTERARFQRNETLVSYEKIPEYMKEKIVTTYLAHTPVSSKKKIMDYLIEKRCKNLLDDIESF